MTVDGMRFCKPSTRMNSQQMTLWKALICLYAQRANLKNGSTFKVCCVLSKYSHFKRNHLLGVSVLILSCIKASAKSKSLEGRQHTKGQSIGEGAHSGRFGLKNAHNSRPWSTQVKFGQNDFFQNFATLWHKTKIFLLPILFSMVWEAILFKIMKKGKNSKSQIFEPISKKKT